MVLYQPSSDGQDCSAALLVWLEQKQLNPFRTDWNYKSQHDEENMPGRGNNT